MKSIRFLAAAALIAASGLALHMAQAQLAGTQRIDLKRHDLSAQGREVIANVERHEQTATCFHARSAARRDESRREG